MERHVSADLELEVRAPARLAFQIAAAAATEEVATMTLDGNPVGFRELPDTGEGRTWVVDSAAGALRCSYEATVVGSDPPAPVELAEKLTYLRPSRYGESDRITGLAGHLFGGVEQPGDVLAGVASWVGTHLDYVIGSSGPTDGAVDTLLAGRGVCRDFAHLAVALLRARDIPARLVAVYAPGLDPMDFHAVVEACVDDTWYVVDSTLLAPRRSLVRIATGRDAADTAFLTSHGGEVTLTSMTVSATVDGVLPDDDVRELIQLT